MSTMQDLPIKVRLIALVALTLLLAMIIGALSLSSLRNANQEMGEMYAQGVVQSQSLSKIIALADDVRTELLLSLQHAPTSEFLSMHDHPVSLHTDASAKSLDQLDELWLTINVDSADERRLADTIVKLKEEFRARGVAPTLRKIEDGDYTGANRILLAFVNPIYQRTENALNELWVLHEDEAEAAFKMIKEEYDRVVMKIVAALVIGALISTILAYMIISGVSRGVCYVEKAANELAEGDLAARVEYPYKDELGHIAKAFNCMAEKFHNIVKELQVSVGQLASAAEETSVVTAQTRQGIDEQRSETEQVATAINEMNQTVHDVAHNAVHAAEATRQADESSTEGKVVVDKTIDAIGEIASEVEQAAQVIHELERESENIGSVLDVIKSIAEQTNLLALNAAIEAARAGEQGRGFAVVADEVRTLAGRTQASTAEIEEMITRLQSGASNAVSVMESSKSKTGQGVEQAASAGNALETITTAVDRIAEMNTQIASAAEQQSAVTEEINRNVVNISQIAEQTSTGAVQTAQASDDLSKLASQLNGMIAQFRV